MAEGPEKGLISNLSIIILPESLDVNVVPLHGIVAARSVHQLVRRVHLNTEKFTLASTTALISTD